MAAGVTDRLWSVEDLLEAVSMTERQAFGAIVRGVGVYLAAYGSIQIWMVVLRLLLFASSYPDELYRYTAVHDFLYGATAIALGCLLVRKPDWIINWAYQPKVESDVLAN